MNSTEQSQERSKEFKFGKCKNYNFADNSSLAIIIPAFKIRYLKECLNSIDNQTDRNFNVYIGDDNSQEDIRNVVLGFQDSLNITYKKFTNNLGSKSLPKHWERCIEMTIDEEWIWLFSDDDFMDTNCVKKFREEFSISKNDIYKFNSVKFKNDFNVLQINSYPEKINTIDLLYSKLNYINESYAVEFVFKKSLYLKAGGFPSFPLGWCSDDAFWIKCTLFSTIITIKDVFVYWRISDINISGAVSTKRNNLLKTQACLKYLFWLKKNGIMKMDKRINVWIFSWFLKQYKYLKDEDNSYTFFKYLFIVICLYPQSAYIYFKGRNT